MNCIYGPYAANIYFPDNSYQLVLDWAYDSIYFKYNDKWIVFTTNIKHYNSSNTFYYDSEKWNYDIDFNIINYKSQIDELINTVDNNKIFFEYESYKSFELLEKIKLLLI